MSKIYCKNCKHCSTNIFSYVVCCDIKPYYEYNYYEKTKIWVQCQRRNKNNDCKYFEKKEIEPEKLQVTSPPPKIKKSFWGKKEWRKYWGLK